MKLQRVFSSAGSKRCNARPTRELEAAAMANANGSNPARLAGVWFSFCGGASEFFIARMVRADQDPGYSVFYPYTTGGHCLMVPLAGWLAVVGRNISGVLPKPSGMKRKLLGLSQRYVAALRKQPKPGPRATLLLALGLGRPIVVLSYPPFA